MSYIEKCVYKTDLLMNKLKPSQNIILFILSENNYLGYTLSDIKEVMKESKNHYLENENKLEQFFYLPHRIVIDNSLQQCYDEKVNTMKLVKNKNKFRIGFGVNKILYEFYSVEPMKRSDINCNENSFFDYDLKEKEENEEVVSDSSSDSLSISSSFSFSFELKDLLISGIIFLTSSTCIKGFIFKIRFERKSSVSEFWFLKINSEARIHLSG